VTTIEVFRAFRPARPIAGFSFEALERHSKLAARIAAKLPKPENDAGTAVVAAMLHDAGKLVFASQMPEDFELALETSARRNLPLQMFCSGR
jgi:HD-like signal output (HDOD) protein